MAQEAAGCAGVDVAQYSEAGYLLVPNLVSRSLLARLQAETERLIGAGASLTQPDKTYDLEEDHRPGAARIRRITRPDLHSQAFRDLLRHEGLVSVIRMLLGTSELRFLNCKLNVKASKGGSAIEYHQDWAYYPHTNDSLLAVGVFLDDVHADNGPLRVFPGTHRGPIYNHHNDEGIFVGGIGSLDAAGLDPEASSVAVLGSAGSCSFHHVRLVHGSDWNVSGAERRILFIEVAAADAWPLLAIGQPSTTGWIVDDRFISGEFAREPRMTSVPVRIPLPGTGEQTLYQKQRHMSAYSFGKHAGSRAKL